VVTGLASGVHAFMRYRDVPTCSFVDFGATQFTLSGIGLSDRVAARLRVDRRDDPHQRKNTEQSLSDDIQGLQGWYMFAAAGGLILPVAFIVFPDGRQLLPEFRPVGSLCTSSV